MAVSVVVASDALVASALLLGVPASLLVGIPTFVFAFVASAVLDVFCLALDLEDHLHGFAS